MTVEQSMPDVRMETSEWQILEALLREYLPGRSVWAYGSRARKDRIRKHSDLDLAISGARENADKIWELVEALDESLIPYKVELVFLDGIGEDFRRRIEPDFVLLQKADNSAIAGINH